MRISWRYLLLSLALVLLLGLALLNQALFFAYLIAPIARILWLIGRLFLMVDQGVYWAVLILITFIVGLWIFPHRPEHPYRSSYHQPPWVEDRAADWEAMLQAAEDSPDGRLALQRELANLNRSIGALVEGNEQAEISLPSFKAGPQQRLQATLGHFFLFQLIHQRGRRQDTEFKKSVEVILHSMEIKLEINHDRASNHPNDD